MLTLLYCTFGVFACFCFGYGHMKRKEPIVEAIIVQSDERKIIYEYEIFGKVLRRLQKINGKKENLKEGDIIIVHFSPENPKISIYNPPYFYVPFIHLSSAKEVEYVHE